MSLRFRIVFSCACAVLALLACLAYGDQVRGEAEQAHSDALERYGGELVRLVVANDSLEAGDTITQADVSERDWASTLAPDGAITSLDEVVGRQVSVPAAKGAPLTELNFRETSAIGEVPEGHVAVTLPITDKLGIPRSIAQGTRLEAYRIDGATSTPVASDMQVLSSPEFQGSLSSQAEVTVSVLPGQVSDILAASAAGDLRLVLPAEDVALADGAGNGAAGADAQAPEEVAAVADAAAPAEVGVASEEQAGGAAGDAANGAEAAEAAAAGTVAQGQQAADGQDARSQYGMDEAEETLEGEDAA